MLDLAVAIPTLVGSILSMFAAGSIFLCYLVLPPRIHYRHALILNLAAADFFNATNNSISGIYAIIHRSIPPGFACSLNGWVGQLTVQATDFSILYMSIATVLTLRRWNYQPPTNRKTKLIITFGIWLVPLSTSTTGLALSDYKPVSGNWCWLSSTDQPLRYALGHAWRLAIIFTIICLYVYLFIHIHRHFSAMRMIASLDSYSTSSPRPADMYNEKTAIYIHEEFVVAEEPIDSYWAQEPPIQGQNDGLFPHHPNDIPHVEEPKTPPLSPYKIIKQIIHPQHSSSTSLNHHPTSRTPFLSRDPLALIRRSIPKTNRLTTTIQPINVLPSTIKEREMKIQKLLLLNAYPIMYILLWIPGITNRFVELGGGKSRVLSIAQASTQFVGLANAVVYGYNEQIWSLAGLWWEHKTRKWSSREEGEESEVAE